MTRRAKPLFGQPCNRCGLCCMKSPCPLNVVMLGGQIPCPSLTADGIGGFYCGLAASFPTEAEREAAGLVLGLGFGCDAVASAEDARAAEAERPRLASSLLEAKRSLSPETARIIQGWSTVYMQRHSR